MTSCFRPLKVALCGLVLALAPACARVRTAPPQSAERAFGAVDPRRAGTPLLGREAPNTTMLAIDAGIAGDRVSGLLDIPLQTCAIVIARAGSSVEDVDLLVYGEDGSVVGTDEAPDKTPGILICPPHPARVWVSARIAAGHGLVAIGAQRVAPAEAERTASLYSVKTGAGTNGQRAGVWPGIEERIEAHRNDLGGSWQDVRRVALPLDARIPTRLSAQVDAGRCLDALVLPAEEVGHVELLALDGTGAIVGRATPSGRDRYLVVCSAADASIALEIRPQSGRGLGVVLFSRTRPGTEQDLDTVVTRLEAFPLSELEREVRDAHDALARSGYGPPSKVSGGTLEVGRRLTVPIHLSAGCSRLDLVGGSPLRGVEAWVWTQSGALVSHAKSGGRALAFACGPAGPARLDLESTLRSGPFSVFMRAEPDTHPALANNPLAAGRLLSHVVERGIIRRASEIGQVTEHELSPSRLSTLELTVPFGRCVDVTLALGADALGAEIRLVSRTTGNQIALARGPHSTSARVCSLEAATAGDNLKTVAELRVRSGSGRGLVATRLLSPSR